MPREPTHQDARESTQAGSDASTVENLPERNRSDSAGSQGQSCQQATGATVPELPTLRPTADAGRSATGLNAAYEGRRKAANVARRTDCNGDALTKKPAGPLDAPADACNDAGMSKTKLQPTLTDVLKAAIVKSGLTCYRIGKATRIDEANLGRFMRGELSIRLDKADRLAAYLGLRLVPDPDAKPPEPTPENLARPMLARRIAKRRGK